MARVTLNQAAFNANRQSNVDILAICAHVEDLTEIIKCGKRRGFEFIWASQLWAAMQGKAELPAHPALLCVDDGRQGMFTVTHPAVVAQGVKANAFLTSDFLYGLAVDASLSSVGQPPISWANARTMRDSGLWEFHNHTRTHQTTTNILNEYQTCSAAIVAELGVPAPIACAYPNGNVTINDFPTLQGLGIQMGFDFEPSSNSGTNRFSTLGDARYMINRIFELDISGFRFVRQRSIVAAENDMIGGINYLNALGFWTFSAGTAYQSNGFELYINGGAAVGSPKSIITTDYFHVMPSDILHYKGLARSLGHTVGTAGLRIQQYDVNESPLTPIDLVVYTATSTGYPNIHQDVTLSAGCRFIRLEAWSDAAYNGSFWSRANVLRVY